MSGHFSMEHIVLQFSFSAPPARDRPPPFEGPFLPPSECRHAGGGTICRAYDAQQGRSSECIYNSTVQVEAQTAGSEEHRGEEAPVHWF
ncbi:uncharacterized protein N7483_000739 [Penicillium malachiteum]|uniref:uncharacterized protein n=1 Tax=Penicillium malachiteum TaxID=1324776 RepID=UPI00254969F9|nr:uncharacterized protein N7483_000739 [Penicillium malachiteum]KAJ5735614.1 hypothetical protein N7483_000739 [Penicillium malachiteum]